MVLIRETDPCGTCWAQDWECPTCGKRQEVKPRAEGSTTEIRTTREGRLSAAPPASVALGPTTSFQCARGHPTLNMVELNFDYCGTWYQCPQCLTRRLVTATGILDKSSAQYAIAQEKEPLGHLQAEEQRRAEEERAARSHAAEQARIAAADAESEERDKMRRAEARRLTALRITILASPILFVMVLAWAVLSSSFWRFVGGAALTAFVGACHWWFVLPTWDAFVAPTVDKRLRVVLTAVNILCAIGLGIFLVMFMRKAQLGPLIALGAGLLYFGFMSLAEV
jgi:cation transport ATPase